MRKLTRDEERFKSCLKKSKSKILTRSQNSVCQLFWYFDDVEQTGWHPDTIGELIEEGLITFGLMEPGRYHDTKWIG